MKTQNSELKQRLERIIKNNPYGFTANANGELIKANKGYAVSITNNSNKRISQLIDNVLKLNMPITETAYFGGWRDSESKKSFLDITLIKSNKKDAIATAKAFNQLAIFDFSQMKEVKV